MRQGQQNKRARGRHRKPQNSANRSFESSGPEVKIRGNAAHVAEKYVALARDALSSGDLISAENYHQHAEHYFRILATQTANQQAKAQASQTENASADGEKTEAGETASTDTAEVKKENGAQRTSPRGRSRSSGRQARSAKASDKTNGASETIKPESDSPEAVVETTAADPVVEKDPVKTAAVEAS